jgi:hypothetical protein
MFSMKKFLPVLFCLLFFYSANAQNKKPVIVRFDGFYQSVADASALPDDKTWKYLRFYPNGKVISVTSTGNVSDLKKWFSIKKHRDFGYWELNENQLYFSTTSKEGTVIYDGFVVDKFYLELKIKSLINGYAGSETYYFVKIPDLK